MPHREATPEDGDAYETGCWIWTGYMVNGEPLVRTKTSTTTARRAYYKRAGHTIPEGHVLASLCGNSLCVRPEHHEPLTRMQLEARKRVRVLTPDRADAARRAVEAGMSKRHVAEVLNADEGTIRRVCDGRHWTQRQDEPDQGGC